jgi:cobalt-zinc-cadmium efflux system membrane fusion protein
MIILITTFGMVSACREKEIQEAKAEDKKEADAVTLTPAQYEASAIALGKLERKAVGSTIQVNGMLDVPPQNLVTVAAPMGGFVRSTKLLQGMKVNKGEVLAIMENQEYIQLQQDYLDNRSKLEFLETEYARQTELARENVNAQKTVQQVRSQYESTKANVKGLEARLAMINISPASLTVENIRSSANILAPISGFVTTVNVNIGQFVNATDVMFKLVNLEHIHAELQVFEKDIRNIREGQKVSFRLAHEDQHRSATIYLIGREISPDRTVRVHCHLDQEDQTLLPGMYITATVETALEEKDVVPSTAVVHYEGETFIFIQQADRQFQIVKVETGTPGEEYTPITWPGTLDRGTPVVVKGAAQLLGVLRNAPEQE